MKEKPIEGFVEQRNDDASQVTCTFKGISVAALLTVENHGRKQTSAEAITVIR